MIEHTERVTISVPPGSSASQWQTSLILDWEKVAWVAVMLLAFGPVVKPPSYPIKRLVLAVFRFPCDHEFPGSINRHEKTQSNKNRNALANVLTRYKQQQGNRKNIKHQEHFPTPQITDHQRCHEPTTLEPKASVAAQP